MIFHRFQGREELDTHSYCEFLVDIWFGLDNTDWDDLDDSIKEEILEELDEKWGLIPDICLCEHEEALKPLLPQIEDDSLTTII